MARNDKSALPGGTAMLVLALLKEQEMYGYQIIEELEKRSNQVFHLQEGTLYPLLHSLEKDKLAFVAGCIETYGIDLVHFTTCQTVQLHNLNEKTVCRIALEALEHGIITEGAEAEYFPRNVMVSLFPVWRRRSILMLCLILLRSPIIFKPITANAAEELKVAFSNSAENLTHATFRDLGFAARPDGLFDVYSAGGLGINPSFGIKVRMRWSRNNSVLRKGHV